MAHSDRIKRIYDFSAAIGTNPPENTYYYDLHRLALNEYKDLERWEKIARSTAGAIENQKIYIEDFDKIIGRVFSLMIKR